MSENVNVMTTDDPDVGIKDIQLLRDQLARALSAADQLSEALASERGALARQAKVLKDVMETEPKQLKSRLRKRAEELMEARAAIRRLETARPVQYDCREMARSIRHVLDTALVGGTDGNPDMDAVGNVIKLLSVLDPAKEGRA